MLQALDDLILSTQQDTLEVSIRPSYFYQSKGVKIYELVQMKRYAKCLISNICRFAKVRVSDVLLMLGFQTRAEPV